MAARKPGFTLEQHEQLGLELQTIRDRMLFIGTELANHFPQKTEVAGLAKIVSNDLENLRSQCEEVMFKKYKNKTDIDLTQVYYRAIRKDHVRNPQPIRPFPSE
ncbi:MAG: hypothetical protein MI863_20680 [Desulfobacterales bacterium]|nr:hypothetical protein [Desulfobacterales bacterium]